ncbi:NEP-interacting protein 1 [Citrus sinensis]|uniref:NEP-interacting protein 1 n=3 Tax=Citrus sinensis TaxID=2711 RepID=A0ACB8J6D0_CITSI|nr:NEP-interacting protein 1 [Citrus sinensis]
MDDRNDKSAKCKFVLIMLFHMLILFVEGRRVEFMKNRELLMHEGTVKTIKGEDGDVIDCVDINKQPAFNHPLLKSHTIQMKTHVHSSGTESENNHNILFQSWHKNGECPEGTIPILRTPHSNRRRRSYPTVSQKRRANDFSAPPALVGGQYYGARATINVWNPATYQGEFSFAQIWVGSGEGDEANTMEVGWLVNNGENKTRLFTYWTRDDYRSTGCYNLVCPGFVQTTTQISLGAAVEPVSRYGAEQFEMIITITKDKSSGNWWLLMQDQFIGYWPGSIFTSLADCSTEINWGGEITNSEFAGHHTSTQMGSGHFPEESFGKACFFRKIGYVDESGNMRDPKDLQVYVTKPPCYDLRFAKYEGDGISFYFGGPGYSDKCP